jgi:hypothetical protein
MLIGLTYASVRRPAFVRCELLPQTSYDRFVLVARRLAQTGANFGNSATAVSQVHFHLDDKIGSTLQATVKGPTGQTDTLTAPSRRIERR